MSSDDHFSAEAALFAPDASSASPSPTISPPSPSSPAAEGNGISNSNGSAPPWARAGPRSPGARRLSRPYSVRRASSQQQQNRPLTRRVALFFSILARKTLALFLGLTPLQRGLVVAALAALAALSVLGLVYSHEFFAFLVPLARSWRDLPLGWAILWLVTFATAFPPMIGYSSAVSLGGIVFGFPWGWPIVASASVAGSLAAFLTSRGIFSGYVHGLVGRDKRFVALGQVLRHDGLGVLTMIRLCPLPFSLSNGFLATIPSIRPWAFAVATALASPKLAVHVFIGSRLALIIEEGNTMSTSDKIINYASMVIGGLLGLGVGLFIWRRTVARAAELAAEEGEEIDAEAGGGDDADADFADDDETEESRLVGGRRADGAADHDDDDDVDADAAALMDEDDISLWETGGADGWGYSDSLSPGDEEAAIQGKDTTHSNGNRK